MNRIILQILSVTMTLCLTARVAYAREVSAVSGSLKSSSTKTNGTGSGSEQTLALGVRYADVFDGSFHWFAHGGFSIQNFSAKGGRKAPENSVGLNLFGGMRLYFQDFSNHLLPFVGVKAGYLTDHSYDGSTDKELERSGLYYYGDIGFRLDLDRDFFIDFETQIFESALFATEKTRVVNAESKNESETTKTGLQVSSSGPLFSTTSIGLGFKF